MHIVQQKLAFTEFIKPRIKRRFVQSTAATGREQAIHHPFTVLGSLQPSDKPSTRVG